VDPPLRKRLVQMLRELDLEEVEAAWYGEYLVRGLRDPAEDPSQRREQTTAKVIYQVPALVRASATPFQRWLSGQFQGPEVWPWVAGRMERSWLKADNPETLAPWFVEGDRGHLIRLLSQQGYSERLSSALAERCRQEQGWSGLAFLGELLRAVGRARRDRPPALREDFLGQVTAGLLRLSGEERTGPVLVHDPVPFPRPCSPGKPTPS
jgi:hypothetical protein